MHKIITWALWSPRNAGIVAVGLCLALTVGVVLTVTGHTSLSRSSTAAPTTTPTIDPTRRPAPSLPDPNGVAAPKPVQPTGERDNVPTSPAKSKAAAQAAAESFMASWLKGRTTDHDAWMGTMRPLVAPAMVPYLDMTPAAAIPNTKVKTWGEAEPGNDYSTIPLLLADRTKLSLELVLWDGKWVVANMDEKA